MATILLLVIILLLPALVLLLRDRLKIIRWLSPIVVCYILGMIAGNVPFYKPDNEILRTAAAVSVCLATPMLLFSCNFVRWVRNSRNTFISFFAGTVAVVAISSLAFFIFRDQVDECWKVAGMTVGLYTGATVNLTAIGVALNVGEETFIVLNSSDLIFGGLYFFFLITAGKKVLGKFLPAYQQNGTEDAIEEPVEGQRKPADKKRVVIADVLKSLAVSISIFGASAGISLLAFGRIEETLIILLITTLGIAFSFHKKINRLRHGYEAGDYLLLVFAVAIGALARYSELVTDNLPIVIFCAIVVFGSVLLHLLISYFFRLEDDTVMITSAAVLFGPAFILPVAQAVRNRQVIVAGLSMALLGNAFGTYLGIALAYFLKNFF
jgi:uncharacterized membrane protein